MSDTPRKSIGAKPIITIFTAVWISLLVGYWLGENILEKTSEKTEPIAMPSSAAKVRPVRQEVMDMQKEIDEANSENGIKEPEPVITAAPVEEKKQETASEAPPEKKSEDSLPAEDKPAEAADTSASDIEPAPTPTAESPENDIRPTPENVAGPFTIHFSTHKDKKMAENFQAHLLEKDIDARIIVKETDSGTVYSICSEEFADRNEAQKFLENARSKGFAAELF